MRAFINKKKGIIMGAIVLIAMTCAFGAKTAWCNKRGDGYIGEALKILISVVLGALLLSGLYLLFNSVVLPTLTDKITNLFNYAG